MEKALWREALRLHSAQDRNIQAKCNTYGELIHNTDDVGIITIIEGTLGRKANFS